MRLFLAVLLTVPLGLAACSSTPPVEPTPAVTVVLPGRQDYLDALAAIDARLVAKPDRAISHGREVCQQAGAGEDNAILIKDAAARDNVDQVQAAAIVAAAKRYLCPPK